MRSEQQASAPGATARLGDGFLWDAWYVVAPAHRLKAGSARVTTVMDQPILVGRGRDGGLYALRDRCAHRAVPLSGGRRRIDPVSRVETLECPYHGWRFRTDGRCEAIPALDGLPDQGPDDLAQIRLRQYPIVEQQGLVWIWMSQKAGSTPQDRPPRLPGLAAGRACFTTQVNYPVHFDHAVLGLIDPAHGPFVHRQWWWRRAGTRHAKSKAFAPSDFGFVMMRHPPSRNSHAYALLGRAPQTEITFRLPGLRWEHVTIGGAEMMFFSAMTPLTARSTQMTQVLWCRHPLLTLLSPLFGAATRAFLRQDGRVLALQAQGLADEAAPFLFVGDADQQGRWYAMLKREWFAHRREGRAFRNPVSPTTLRWVS